MGRDLTTHGEEILPLMVNRDNHSWGREITVHREDTHEWQCHQDKHTLIYKQTICEENPPVVYDDIPFWQ